MGNVQHGTVDCVLGCTTLSTVLCHVSFCKCCSFSYQFIEMSLFKVFYTNVILYLGICSDGLSLCVRFGYMYACADAEIFWHLKKKTCRSQCKVNWPQIKFSPRFLLSKFLDVSLQRLL